MNFSEFISWKRLCDVSIAIQEQFNSFNSSRLRRLNIRSLYEENNTDKVDNERAQIEEPTYILPFKGNSRGYLTSKEDCDKVKKILTLFLKRFKNEVNQINLSNDNSIELSQNTNNLYLNLSLGILGRDCNYLCLKNPNPIGNNKNDNEVIHPKELSEKVIKLIEDYLGSVTRIKINKLEIDRITDSIAYSMFFENVDMKKYFPSYEPATEKIYFKFDLRTKNKNWNTDYAERTLKASKSRKTKSQTQHQMTLLSGDLIDQKLTGISFHPENPTISSTNKGQNKLRKKQRTRKR